MSPEGKSRRGVPRWLMLVGALTAIGPISIDMYLPGFAAIERDLGGEGVEGTMAAYFVGIAAGQLFYGPLSDRFGRKRPLYVGFALYTLGSLGCVFASNMLMLTVMRVVQALGGCSGMVIGRAIVRDRCEPHEAARAFSTLMTIVALGPMLAPAVGGLVITTLGWRATFIFQALLGIGLLLAVYTVFRESPREAPPVALTVPKVLATYLSILKDPTFLACTLISGFGMAAMFSYVTGAPTVLPQRYGLSEQAFGLLIGLNGLAFMAASRLNVRSLRTLTPEQVVARYIWIPTALAAALLILAAIWNLPLWLVVTLQLAFFVCVGRVSPNVAALALAPHGANAGSASALVGAIQSVVGVSAGLAVAVLNDGTIRTLAAVMTTAASCALLSYLWMRSQVRSNPRASRPS